MWRQGLDEVRARVAAEVPVLTQPSRWPPGHRLVTVTRRLGTAVGAVGPAGAAGGRLGQPGRASPGGCGWRPSGWARPTSSWGRSSRSGEGIFPAELVGEFKLCRDRVPAEPFRLVREVIEADLGRPLEEVFRWVDRTPLAAASIAQVHAATLRTGEPVVVKVQRPTVARLVRDDLRVMAWLAPKLVGRIPIAALANPPALVELFAETITEELDFRLEAENMLDIARTFAELGQRGYVVPRPHPTLVTPRVLVMERLDGFRFDDVVGMHDAGVDTEAVVRTGMIGFIEGAIIHGIFHGDLHGGNLFVLPDGRTALLDFGITGRLDETKRLAFLRLLMGGSVNDVMVQLAALRDLGALPPDADLDGRGPRARLDEPFVDPHDDVRRAAGGRAAADRQGAAGLRRPHAQGADAVRQEHGVPRRRHRHPGPRPRPVRRDRPDLDVLRHPATATGSLADVGIDPRTIELDMAGREGRLRRRRQRSSA